MYNKEKCQEKKGNKSMKIKKNPPRLWGYLLWGSVILLLAGCRLGVTDQGAAENTETEAAQAKSQEVQSQPVAGDLSQEQWDGMQKKGSWADRVVEVGILADCTNPYTVVCFEIFGREAGACSRPLVVELHDSRDGYEAQKGQLEWLLSRGVDVLLVDMADRDRQKELKADLEGMDCPVIYFGTRPKEELLEDSDIQYIGLSQEEALELSQALAEERFEETGFRERAHKTGEELLQRVLELFPEE